MPEENQNVGKRIWQANTSNLRSWADNMIAFQNQARQEQMNKFNDERDTGLKDVYTSWLNSTNHWVAQNCDRTFRIWLVAKWIRDYFDDYANVDDIPLVDSFKDSNPEYEDAIWQFVLDDSQICDPNPLYQKLWFYWEPQVETPTSETPNEDDSPNNFVDRVKNVWKSFLSFYETWWSAVRNAVDFTLWALEWDQTMWAINNYAEMNGVDTTTPEWYAEASEAISSPEWMDMYKATPQRAMLRWMESALDAAFTILAPEMKWMLSVWENTPWISDLLEIWWYILQWGWRIVNHSTPLYFYRNTLQTEEEKQEFDAFIGTLGFMKLFQKRWGRTKWDIKETLLKEIDPETTITEFKKRITDTPSDLKNLWKNIANKMPTQWEMIARINKMTPWEKTKFQQDYWGEVYWDFLNRIWIVEWDEWAIVKLHAYKTSLFDQITQALNEIWWEYDVNNPWMQEMIKENLRNATEVMERDPSIVNRLSEIANKYFKEIENPDWSVRINWKLNASEIKFLMRYFAEKTRLWFNKDVEPKKVQRNDNIYAKVLDDITRIAEDNWFENMWEMSRDIQKSHFLINALWKDLAKKYGKSWLDAADILALFWDIESWWLKFVIKRIITSEWAKKNYVKILNKMQWLTPERQWANLEKIRDINSKNMFDKWVKEIEKESKTPKLWEDPKYSNNPVDYTAPTRVNTEWEAWRYGQILETKKNTWLEEK